MILGSEPLDLLNDPVSSRRDYLNDSHSKAPTRSKNVNDSDIKEFGSFHDSSCRLLHDFHTRTTSIEMLLFLDAPLVQ